MSELRTLLLRAFFRCISCDVEPPFADHFPLCEHCLQALMPAPPLCSQCASPLCVSPEALGEGCKRPWIQIHPLDSQITLFQLTDDAYATLKRWKSRRGPLFDRRVFKQIDLGRLEDYARHKQVQAVVPIPQNFVRSWMMNGSPADILASWISKRIQIPKIKILKKTARFQPGQKRQAELGGWARMQSLLHFEVDSEKEQEWMGESRRPDSVLLVDDFSTTGQTLAEAARTLKDAGFQKVHALCLGMRSR